MTIEAIGALGSATSSTGVDLNQLFEQYQQTVTETSNASGAAGLTGVSGVSATDATDPAMAARGSSFAQIIGEGLQKVDSLDATQSAKAIQAATGDLKDVHDYVIAAQEAQTATALTTTLRDKALEAFNEIMRMPL